MGSEMCIRDSAYIVSAIAVLGVAMIAGLVILSHLRGRPAVVEEPDEDLS